MTRRSAALQRSAGYAAPADRPRSRRATEPVGSPAVARAMMHGVEVRDQPDTDGTVGFRTYASVTEHPYDMWDMFGPYSETVAATAFDVTLAADPDVAFLLNHRGMTLARTASGTLRIGRDDTGLWYEPRLDPGNSVVRDVLSGVRRGDLNESSFAFRINAGEWDPDYTAYRITQVDIDRGDVSVVNFGANPATGEEGITLGLDVDADAIDVEQLDDEHALALTVALQRRTARAAGAGGMSRAELAALAALAAPHPLSVRQ